MIRIAKEKVFYFLQVSRRCLEDDVARQHGGKLREYLFVQMKLDTLLPLTRIWCPYLYAQLSYGKSVSEQRMCY